MMQEKIPSREEYKYGFHDDVESVYKTEKGLTEEIVREISAKKNEQIGRASCRERV